MSSIALRSLEKSSCIFWNIKFVDYFSQCSPHSLKGMGVSGSPAANVPVSTLPVSSYLFIIPTSAFPRKGKVHLQITIMKKSLKNHLQHCHWSLFSYAFKTIHINADLRICQFLNCSCTAFLGRENIRKRFTLICCCLNQCFGSVFI